MQLAGITARQGTPVMTIDGVDKAVHQTAPMRVFTRANVGRFDGYASLATALSAARNLSRGADRSAVVVEKATTGVYEVREAVWQYFWGRNDPPRYRAPFRHFHFEDGTFSQYTAQHGDRRVEVTAGRWMTSYDGITRWLVDGSRVIEVAHTGPKY